MTEIKTEDILKDIKEKAVKRHIPVMLEDSLGELINIIKETKPQNILEIGTAVGFSGSVMLINSPESVLETIEIDEDRFNEAKDNFRALGIDSRVKQISGDAVEIVRYLDRRYDFILLDGPKGHYSEMLFYLDRLLNSGGVIFADNVLFKGKVEGDDYPQHKHRTIIRQLRDFNGSLLNDKRYKTELKDIGDGILIARKIKM